jgi:SAM-dependent methyltransferase
MTNNKIFLKKMLSYIPFLDRFIRKIYYKKKYGTFFIPVNPHIPIEQILKNRSYKLNLKNFAKFKDKFNYFLISKKSSFKDYPKKKLDKLLDFVKNDKAEVAYDGDDLNHTEITSSNVIDFYSGKYPIENYPYRFFYIKKNLNIKNIGSEHRSYNFNGTFQLPAGGKTIGDGGDVAVRLNFIPNLNGKTFLDIGAEEGYAVFNALKKNAKFAKGLNINESKEYDFFPEYLRPNEITSRKRNEIETTQQFLIKEYALEKNNNFKFEYNNIYNLSDEKFDFVFCFGVLYHLKNPYLALENLYKVTNETLIIETQGIKNDNYPNCRIDLEDGFIRHSSNALTILLKKVGFKKVKVLFDAYDSSMKIMNIVLKAEK